MENFNKIFFITVFVGLVAAGIVWFYSPVFGAAPLNGPVSAFTYRVSNGFGAMGTSTPAATSTAILIPGARRVTATIAHTSTTTDSVFTLWVSDNQADGQNYQGFRRAWNVISGKQASNANPPAYATTTVMKYNTTATSTMSLDLTNSGYYAVRCAMTPTSSVHIHNGSKKTSCSVLVEY